MTQKSNMELCLLYLRKYAEKDLDGVEKLFAENIILRDWKILVKGKQKAMEETRKNFESVDTIAIEVLSAHESKNTVAAELQITLDSNKELYVVDVISFDSGGQIESIRAYLGRGDH